jgi:hypothetical protein
MVAAERNEVTLTTVLETRESPWHEDNLELFAGLRLGHVNIPTQAKTGLEWATGRSESGEPLPSPAWRGQSTLATAN